MPERDIKSVFISFDPPEGKERFLEVIEREDLGLSGKIYSSKRRPEVVLNDVSPDELTRVEEIVGDSGKFFSDRQFRPDKPSG